MGCDLSIFKADRLEEPSVSVRDIKLCVRISNSDTEAYKYIDSNVESRIISSILFTLIGRPTGVGRHRSLSGHPISSSFAYANRLHHVISVLPHSHSFVLSAHQWGTCALQE